MKASELYRRLVEAGVPVDSHESDLYVPVNETTREMISRYVDRGNVTEFTSQVDGQQWFDVPFAYQPFWTAKAQAACKHDNVDEYMERCDDCGVDVSAQLRERDKE